jgi:hypothetical protein
MRWPGVEEFGGPVFHVKHLPGFARLFRMR